MLKKYAISVPIAVHMLPREGKVLTSRGRGRRNHREIITYGVFREYLSLEQS